MSTAPNVQYVTVPELNGKRLPILSPPGDGSMNPSQITDAEYAVLERRGTAVSKIALDLMNYHRAWKRAVSDGSGGDSGGGILSSILGQAGSLFGGKKSEGNMPVQTYETQSSGMSPVLIVGALAAAGGLAWWAFAKPAPKRAANGRRRRRGRRT